MKRTLVYGSSFDIGLIKKRGKRQKDIKKERVGGVEPDGRGLTK